MSEFWQWDAVAVARAVRTRKASSREIVGACLARINEINPILNAIVDCRPDEALEAADEADAAVARGDDLGPLHGVPMTTKINADQRGYATTNGIAAFKDNIASDDNPVIANLRSAGAVFIGRTNTPSFSFRWFTDNDLHGETLNPHDSGLTPGGSSGGAASAVAGGMGPLAHGNDIGGSIRYPAYACGICGLRPSLGRIPSRNASMKAERSLITQLMAVHGPMARSIRDLRVGLKAMAKPDPRDPNCVPVPLSGPAVRHPIRVAMSIDPFGRGVDPVVANALRAAAKYLEAAGYVVEEIELPRMQEAADLWPLLVMNDAQRSFQSLGPDVGGKAFRNAYSAMLEHTPPIDLEGFMVGLERRTSILRDWFLFCERYPLTLLPVSMERPFKRGLDQEGTSTMGRIMSAQDPLLVFAVLGLPAVAVPTGIADGVPMGVQIVGAQFREDLCLDAAEVIEAQAPIGFPKITGRHRPL